MDNSHAQIYDATVNRLPPELLTLIFFENAARIDDSTQLYTARSSSQVCGQWRDILLSVSSLWGRLIDVESLRFHHDNYPWRKEVLKRADSALLWVNGYLDANSSRYPTNFLSFLEQNWERIEGLHMVIVEGPRTVHYWHPLYKLAYGLRLNHWEAVKFRAPNLKSFVLIYPEDGRFSSQFAACSLFNGHAPKLREISTSNIKFDVRSSWLRNIRDITFSTAYSVQEVCQVLGATPLLTDLRILMDNAEYSSEGDSLPPEVTIRLPLLENFVLKTTFGAAIPIFQRLDVPASCIPDVSLSEHCRFFLYPPGDEKEYIGILRDEVAKFMRRHLDARRPTHMKFICQNWGPWELEYYSSTATSLSTVLSLYNELGRPGMVECMSMCEYLPSVTEMDLDLDYFIQDAYLSRFPLSLKSLTTLITTEDTLNFFYLYIDGSTRRQSCFPSLKVLKLSRLEPRSRFNPRRRNPGPLQVIRYLFDIQIAGNSPISVFDLTCINISKLHDMEYLDQVPGLKTVKWFCQDTHKSVEYECGSGRSRLLQFTQIRRSKRRKKVCKKRAARRRKK